MALETANNISQLVTTNPAATDGLGQADDHIRLIKAALQGTFPFIAGTCVISNSELNQLSGGTVPTNASLSTSDAFVVNYNGNIQQTSLLELINFMANNLPVTNQMIVDGTIQTADIADGAITAAKMASSAVTPAGIVSQYAGTTAPTGWLMCYGQDVSRTIESDLFAAIGETYGSGDGSTTFNVPDARGRVIAGLDNMGGTSANRLTGQLAGQLNGDTLGATGGAESVTLTTGEIPAHTHTGNVDLRTNWESGTSSQSPVGTGSARYDGTGSSPAFTTNSTGGGAAHNNLQPTLILNYIIKT
jgi:microcystin-dependent protein